MCGIFGTIFSKDRVAWDRVKRYNNFMIDATITSAVRGTDGTGIFAVNRTGGAEILKRPIAPWDFLGQNKTQKMYTQIGDYSAMIGHVRAPTRGGTVLDNTHPFHHGNVILCHNGTLNSVETMGVKNQFGTDSEHIAYALNQHENPVDVLEKIDGAFALVWYDKRTDSMYLARNNQRELHYAHCTKDHAIIIASEWKMLEWLAVRHEIELDKDTVYQVEPGKLMKVRREDADHPEYINFKPYVRPPLANFFPTRYVGPATKPHYRGRTGTAAHQSVSLPFTKDTKAIHQIGLSIGRTIVFTPLDVYLPKAKSKAGVVEGVMKENPWWTVRATGVDIRKIFNPKGMCLEGEVEGVLNVDGLAPIAVLTNVTVSKETKTLTSAKTHIRFVGLFDRELRGIYVPPENKVVPITDANEPQAYLRGPHPQKKITLIQFRELVKDGCAFCQADLFPTDEKKIEWIQDSPVCPTCSLAYNHTTQ
jgi:predicted glutamine amidotransferase